MNSERKNIFEQALQAVGGRLDRSITYDDSMSTEKDRNVLNSIMLKEKKIEYIHKQFDIYTDFLDKTDVSFGHYAAEISKSNQILFDENTHIYEKKAKLCKAVIIDHFYDDFDEYVENLPLDTDFNDINACRDFLPSLCKSDLNKKILDLCCESMTHGLRKRRLDIILDDLNRIEHTNKEQISMKEISYSAFGQLRKYFNHANCHDSTPTELYHWYDMNFKSFKDEVLENLISIPSDGKIPYLEKLKNILEEDFSYLNPDRLELDALFKKHNTSEEEFLNHSISDVKANNYFNDYITSNRDFRNGNIKLEVDDIHAVIFNYYGGTIKNKAIEFTIMKLSELLIYEQRIPSNPIEGNEELSIQKEVLVAKPVTKGYHLVKGTTYDPTFGDFHAALKKFKFIEADLPEFRNAFHGNSGYNKIRWLKNQNELSYLINNLIKKSKIKKYRAWKHTYNIFKLKDEKSISPDIRTNSYNGEHASLNIIIDNL